RSDRFFDPCPAAEAATFLFQAGIDASSAYRPRKRTLRSSAFVRSERAFFPNRFASQPTAARFQPPAARSRRASRFAVEPIEQWPSRLHSVKLHTQTRVALS